MQDTKYKLECAGASDEVGHIIGHFRNSCMVEFLNILQCSLIGFGHEVNSNTFTTKTAASSNTENIKKNIYTEKYTENI